MRDRTSITRDDNPDGVNQYTGGGAAKEASKAASAATKHAEYSHGIANHITAQNAHNKASDLHFKASENARANGNMRAARMHSGKSMDHEDKAKYHESMSHTRVR